MFCWGVVSSVVSVQSLFRCVSVGMCVRMCGLCVCVYVCASVWVSV